MATKASKKKLFAGLNNLEDLQFMPVNALKAPIKKSWNKTVKKWDLTEGEMVGLVCGKLSESEGAKLEAIDVDCKYDLTGKLWEQFKKLIHGYNPQLLRRLAVQRTMSNGYHIIYRCEHIGVNEKLANRPSTEEEKQKSWQDTYDKMLADLKPEDQARRFADNAKKDDKVRVLIETRGEGGYIAVWPSDGYEFINGDLTSIPTITPDERDSLINIARQFNEVHEEYIPPKYQQPVKTKGITPLDDYDQRGDCVQLLIEHGWKFVHERGNKIHLQRAGDTKAQTSGNFDREKNWFTVFSTSTIFNPMKAYRPSAVYAMLNHNGDFTEAARELYAKGYGERHEEKPEKAKAPSTRVIQSRVDPNSDDLSFLATPDDYDPYLQQVRDGTLAMGLTTGSPSLDKHFLFKYGSLVMSNGIDNTGKSVWWWWLLLCGALYHGWKFIIFASENTLGAFMRKMIQFYWGKPIGRMTNSEYLTAKKFIEGHFYLIKAQEELYNYKDIINMVRVARKAKGKIDAGMIDPYNSLKVDLSGFSKLSTHEYHYEALSEIKAYGQQTSFGWFVNHHAVTAAARAKDGEKKYPLPPRKADTEGGQKVANKADDFLTIHRLTEHPTDWNITDVYVRKIKDTETGGMPTALDSPIRFEMYPNMSGFKEYLDFGGDQVDPIRAWHLNNTKGYVDIFQRDPQSKLYVVASPNGNSDLKTGSPEVTQSDDVDDDDPF
jgi:hypothetical protein